MHVIEPLLERGQKAYQDHIEKTYPKPDKRPMGSAGLACVTLEDFLSNTPQCLDFAVHERTLHILTRDGAIGAIMMASVRPRPTP